MASLSEMASIGTGVHNRPTNSGEAVWVTAESELMGPTFHSLKLKPTDDELHMRVHLPHGMEYKGMEVAQVTMKSTGAIKFEWSNTNGGMANVEHTDQGLLA